MTNIEKNTVVEYFKALSDPIRIDIIEFLMNKEYCNCICHIVEKTGKDQSVIYRHLMILEKSGIINTKKVGKNLNACITDKEKIKEILDLVNSK